MVGFYFSTPVTASLLENYEIAKALPKPCHLLFLPDLVLDFLCDNAIFTVTVFKML